MQCALSKYLLVYGQQPPTFAWPGMGSWKVGCWMPKDFWFFPDSAVFPDWTIVIYRDLMWFAIPAAAKDWDGTSRVSLSELWLFPDVSWKVPFPSLPNHPIGSLKIIQNWRLKSQTVLSCWILHSLDNAFAAMTFKFTAWQGTNMKAVVTQRLCHLDPLRGKHKLEGVSLG